MTRDDFLSKVAEIAAEDPSYRLGGKGDDGTCDCIGLIIGAVERAGKEWDGIHGSNWAARHAVSGLTSIGLFSELSPGDLVFKAREPEDSLWALPDRYSGDADQRDYYHVGVVMSVSPLRITHCTSPGGITVDTRLGRWSFRARLSALSEMKGEDSITTHCTVSAASGSTVNLRKAPGGSLVSRVPLGSRVEVTERYGAWSRIRWAQQEGWMKSEYLTAVPDGDLTARLDALEKRVAALEGGAG